jgi:hypothetical protein
MTSSYQGLSGNRAGGADPTPEFLPAQQQADKRLEQSIDRLNQSINSNAEARMLNAQRAGDAMKNLGRLSKTLGDALGIYQAGQIKKYQTQAQALASIGVYDQEKLTELQTQREQDQLAAQQGLSDAQKKAAKDGAPYHVIDGIGKLNAYHLDEMQKIRIGEVATEFPTAFKAYFTENEGATKSRADQLGLVDQFINDSYSKFDGFDPGIVAKYGLPVVNKFKQQARKDIDFQWGQSTSAREVDRAINTLLVDGNIASYVNTVANTVDTKGKIRGEAGAYRYLVDKVLPKAIKANLVSVTDIREMFETSERPGMGGKTYMDLNRVDYNTLDELIEADVAADYTRGEKLETAQFSAEEDAWVEEARNADPATITNDSIDERQKEFIKKYGKESRVLNQWKQHLSIDAVQLEEADKAAKRLIETNSLTSARLNKLPWQIQQRYASVAAVTDKVSADNYKTQLDAIKDRVEQKASVTPMGTRDPSVGVVTSNYQRKFHENLRQQLEANNPNALQDALSITLTEFNTWSADPANFSSNGYNVFADAATVQNLQASARVEQERVNSILRTYKSNALDQVGLVNSTILRNDAANFGQKGFKHHPQIQRISRILQVDPITATNKMIEAYNAANQAQGNPIPLISLSKGGEIIRDELPPQAKAKFIANQGQMTPNKSLQVMAQIPGGYRPEMVPMGFGELVGKAAEKHDIPPGILAGLLEQESGYLPEVINGKRLSSAGAQGIAQFMPATAAQFGIDPFDPESAIDGAAMYLRHLMDNYDFTLREAIYAYNAGPGTVQRYGVGATEENKNYYPGILKKAAKYGYSEAFRDPTMMRPVFQ